MSKEALNAVSFFIVSAFAVGTLAYAIDSKEVCQNSIQSSLVSPGEVVEVVGWYTNDYGTGAEKRILVRGSNGLKTMVYNQVLPKDGKYFSVGKDSAGEVVSLQPLPINALVNQ